MNAGTVLIALGLAILPLAARGQGPAAASRQPTDAAIVQAMGAIERAEGYGDLVAAGQQYEATLGSPRVVEWIDARLNDSSLDDNRRGLLLLERQLSADIRARGTAEAMQLLATRIIAGYALLADSPQQFAAVLENFSALARVLSPQLVRDAFNTPGNTWPDGLLPLMEQLARDWPAHGALAAATRMAEAAGASPAASSPPPAARREPTLAGHWRSTRILFDQPRDEHMVLRPDGSAETWVVTADDRTAVTRGRWRVQGNSLAVDWQDGQQWGQPFAFYEGQLVFPNVANQRQFWELIEQP